MAKRSHRIASRQAAVGKERKRKKKAQVGDKRTVSYTTPPDVIDAPESTAEPVPEPVSSEVEAPATATSPQPARAERVDTSRYQYVISDLRTIGIIAGPLILILIILAFIL